MFILVKIIKKYYDFVQNLKQISILVKICKNLEFGQNFRKISILDKRIGKSRFRSNLPKCRFWTKFQEMLIIIQFSKNVDLGKNLEICRFW